VSERQPDPALHRALLAARDKREARGATGDGIVVTPALRPQEALALDGLLARRRPVLPGQRLHVALSRFEAALRECGIDPRSAYERVGGRALRDRPAERAAAARTQSDLREWLAAHEVSRRHQTVAAWLDDAVRQGRVRADTRSLVEQALRVVAALPASAPVQRTVLAAAVLGGDPHALDPDTPLHRLTMSLLATAGGLDPRQPSREVWAAWNVIVDPISSSVATLNLEPLGDHRLARVLRLLRGSHVVLTHGQLAGAELRWPPALECFSCENPAVLVAAERSFGAACPPMLCTGGRPSDAARLLLASLRSCGATIRHHGDFDLAGVQIFRDLETRHGAVPWRFDVTALEDARRHTGDDAWRPSPATLEDAVGALRAAIAEELLIDVLLEDLGRRRSVRDGEREWRRASEPRAR
jgi:uncharacterized protein (TIGR02679 family)